MAFLNSCQTYIWLCPSEFLDEQTKIVWVMSYMKSGYAQKWTTHIFRWEQQLENSNQTKFLDWEDFSSTFKAEFTPAHSDALAINCCYDFLSLFLFSHHCSITPFHFPFELSFISHA